MYRDAQATGQGGGRRRQLNWSLPWVNGTRAAPCCNVAPRRRSIDTPSEHHPTAAVPRAPSIQAVCCGGGNGASILDRRGAPLAGEEHAPLRNAPSAGAAARREAVELPPHPHGASQLLHARPQRQRQEFGMASCTVQACICVKRPTRGEASVQLPASFSPSPGQAPRGVHKRTVPPAATR